jgi:hypothetical protein
LNFYLVLCFVLLSSAKSCPHRNSLQSAPIRSPTFFDSYPVLSSPLYCSYTVSSSTHPLKTLFSHSTPMSVPVYSSPAYPLHPSLPTLARPLRQVDSPQDHDRRTPTPYRRCTTARTSSNQQIYPALYRRFGPLYDAPGLFPRDLAGFNQRRRKEISREIRYFWVSFFYFYFIFFLFFFPCMCSLTMIQGFVSLTGVLSISYDVCTVLS